MGDDAAIHQLDQERGEARLHDVAAEHHYYSALLLRSGGDGIDYGAEVARDEHIGQGFQKGGETPVLSGRGGELRSGDLVGAPLDRNGANFRKIDFSRRSVPAQVFGDGK
jgi:hypothetical protein